MSLRVLMQRAGTYWQRRLIRILVAALVLAGAIVVQYRLANIPLPVQVEKTNPPYTPATAAHINEDELVVDKPSEQAADSSATDNPTGVLVSGLVKEFVTVDAQFDSAQLSDDLMAKLQRNSPEAPPQKGLQQIGYATEDSDEAQPEKSNQQRDNMKPCRTLVSVNLAEDGRMPSELHFFQLRGVPGTDHYRYFKMKAVGSDLMVELLTRNLAGEVNAPGCSKTLSVGKWHHALTGPVPVKIFVPDGASFKLSFTPFNEKIKWSVPGDFFEPLSFSPLSARAVRKTTREGSSSLPPAFNAESVAGAKPLLLNHLRIGADELQLDFSGQAMVQENGKYAVTFSLWEFAKKYPLLAGLLAMFDAGLLEGLRRVVFRSTGVEQKSKKPRRRSKKNRRASSEDGSS